MAIKQVAKSMCHLLATFNHKMVAIKNILVAFRVPEPFVYICLFDDSARDWNFSSFSFFLFFFKSVVKILVTKYIFSFHGNQKGAIQGDCWYMMHD